MTRVSDNSNRAALQFALNKVKERVENLQMKGTSLKRITKPSDDPISNVTAMEIDSATSDNKQYLRNANYALLNLNTTEKSLEQITDILMKAKEIAIAQASDFYDQDIRRNVSNEVHQLRNQVLAIANKRVGNRYLFAGYSTLNQPFDREGTYYGDTGKMNIEVAKDFFVPVNLSGFEIFYSDEGANFDVVDPSKQIQKDIKEDTDKNETAKRDLASLKEVEPQKFHKRSNIFSQLSTLISALENNDSKLIQNLLEKLDQSITRIITLRTRVGSVISSVNASTSTIESENVDNAAHRSKLVDADIAELFSDLGKEQQVLKTTYKAGEAILSQSLLDFLR